ncbi:LysE family translocator [Alcanivorax sp. DP30]|uniref:LysE family translocator n=1 Tax=Alcanivorax sp. DP30 TaxID=2606217 RepID=UPI00136BB177|nr:LysE family translocator [Alcanivorax sp. DP30]MZR63883.1 LysE family transporter [Alcanivorax sp. DP30]
MTTEQYLALIGFVTVMTATPGPNNLMLMASGANAGFRRSLPHIFGIAIGCQVILVCVSLGLGQLLGEFPQALTLLRFAGALYLLYLAWQLVRSRTVEDSPSQSKPFTFFQAALFQWVNPKAWMMILTGVATFTDPENFTASVAIIAGVFLLLGLPLISSWSLFGAVLKHWLTEGRRLRLFNRTMAVLLIVSLVPTFGLQASETNKRKAGEAQPTQTAEPTGNREPWWLSVM